MRLAFNFVAGVTISGKVVDAAGQPVKYGYVTGFTKADEYGRYGAFNVRTEKDGTYAAKKHCRVTIIPVPEIDITVVMPMIIRLEICSMQMQ